MADQVITPRTDAGAPGAVDETGLAGHSARRGIVSIPGLVIVYWAAATAWVVASDVLLGRFGGAESELLFSNIAKGVVFVSVTSGMLLLLLRRRQRLLDAERDRTAELRERLADSERMDAVGRLAGGVAHDFNNLLTVIRGHVELARLDAVDEQAESFDMMDEAVERAVVLTGELQTVARRQRLDLETVDLGAVVQHHGAVLEAMIPAGIDVVIDVGRRADDSSDVFPVRLDPARFEQVLLNLSTNARDAMPDGGTLRITVARRGSSVVLTFSDTGIGMSSDQLRHCFEPFYTTKPAGKGTGLGLALSYGVVRQSGGDVTVTSEPGVGTTVEIVLPSSEP